MKRNAKAARTRAIDRMLSGEGVGAPESPSPVHQLADYAELVRARQVWRDIGTLKSDPDYQALLGRPTWREHFGFGVRRVTAGISQNRKLAAFAGVMAVAAVFYFNLFSNGQRVTTQIAETRQFSLQDGSTVALGPKSGLQIAFNDAKREITMAPGEAYFSVAHDPARPFVISAGGTRITVVGTKFNVKYDDEGGVRVSVVEGVVKIKPTTALLAKPITLAIPAGKEAIVPPSAQPTKVEALNGAAPDSWRQGQLDYNDVPLSEIVADINRYVPGEVRVAPALAHLRLTTSFRADQAAAFLESLPDILPVILEGQVGKNAVLTERRSAQK